MNKPKYWQETDNCRWKTDTKHKCSICGRKSNIAINFKVGDDELFACFLVNRDCSKKAMTRLFNEHESCDFLLTRVVEYENLYKSVTKTREPIGLSLRYNVMKRDGFQCCLCGNSGKESRLEIDHIRPVSKGGSNKMKNLQTLCFNCNRGKSDHE